jgi:23S rRNA-/tRNA-specific pseudouridylate synthase
MELLALGSVWYLPLSAAPPNIDRFDPTNGIKPRRLTVGDWNTTVHEGDYLRVHFDPRRFCETNRWSWGCNVGTLKDNKAGVVVSRDDDVGYIIIDKPSNIPVHARVDNLLENVASSIGRVLWMETKNELVLKARADKSMSQGHLMPQKKSKQKQKLEQLIYVATPQRLDQNTTGLLVVATKKSFASYFAKLLRTKVILPVCPVFSCPMLLNPLLLLSAKNLAPKDIWSAK